VKSLGDKYTHHMHDGFRHDGMPTNGRNETMAERKNNDEEIGILLKSGKYKKSGKECPVTGVLADYLHGSKLETVRESSYLSNQITSRDEVLFKSFVSVS